MASWTKYPGFCDQAYQSRSENISVDRLINLYTVSNEIGTGKGGRALVARPGCQVFATLGGTGRGLWGDVSRIFAVAGTTLYRIDSGGAVTTLGDIGSGTSPVQIIANAAQVAVFNPNTGILKVHDGTTMQTPTTPAALVQGAYLDSFLFGLAQDSNIIFQSDPNNFLSWDPSNYAERVAEQDRVVTLRADHQNLWLIGEKTTELWFNAGAAGFVLQRVPNAFIESGTASAFSPVSIAGRLVMLSNSDRGGGSLVACTPGRYERISTYAVEKAINGYANWNQATGYGYESQGHTFYVVSFPNTPAQWVYDFTERAWHERYGWNGSAYTMPPGYLHCSAFGSGKNYIMDTAGTVYQQIETLYSDGVSGLIRAQRVAPILADGKRVICHGFRIDQQVLTGLDIGASLRVSTDGGNTYGSAQPRVPSDYSGSGTSPGDTAVLEWLQLGQSTQRGFALELTWADVRNLAVSNAYLKLEECAG